MTVKELIEKLQQLDQNKVVVVVERKNTHDEYSEVYSAEDVFISKDNLLGGMDCVLLE